MVHLDKILEPDFIQIFASSLLTFQNCLPSSIASLKPRPSLRPSLPVLPPLCTCPWSIASVVSDSSLLRSEEGGCMFIAVRGTWLVCRDPQEARHQALGAGALMSAVLLNTRTVCPDLRRVYPEILLTFTALFMAEPHASLNLGHLSSMWNQRPPFLSVGKPEANSYSVLCWRTGAGDWYV